MLTTAGPKSISLKGPRGADVHPGMTPSTDRTQMLSALEQAFDAETPATARRFLATAVDAARRLAASGALTADDRLTVNETLTAMRPRGWFTAV